ncbi:hypothetical protein QYM36_007140, partial [Artemia franciscana]
MLLRLSDGSLVLSAELKAIEMALNTLLQCLPPSRKVIIFIDSKTALQMVSKINWEAPDYDLSAISIPFYKFPDK